jgi:threonine dehydrogenase-like Zn-dependent dehydrogenase
VLCQDIIAPVHHDAARRRNVHAHAPSHGSDGKLRPAQLITHRFPFSRIMDAYETFGNAAKEKALKVIIEF